MEVVEKRSETPDNFGLACIMCKKPNSVALSGHEQQHIRERRLISIAKLKKCMCDSCKELM